MNPIYLAKSVTVALSSLWLLSTCRATSIGAASAFWCAILGATLGIINSIFFVTLYVVAIIFFAAPAAHAESRFETQTKIALQNNFNNSEKAQLNKEKLTYKIFASPADAVTALVNAVRVKHVATMGAMLESKLINAGDMIAGEQYCIAFSDSFTEGNQLRREGEASAISLIGGFTIVSYPARYGASGVMRFMANYDGEIFKRDFGTDTETIVEKLAVSNPDVSLKRP